MAAYCKCMHAANVCVQEMNKTLLGCRVLANRQKLQLQPWGWLPDRLRWRLHATAMTPGSAALSLQGMLLPCRKSSALVQRLCWGW